MLHRWIGASFIPFWLYCCLLASNQHIYFILRWLYRYRSICLIHIYKISMIFPNDTKFFVCTTNKNHQEWSWFFFCYSAHSIFAENILMSPIATHLQKYHFNVFYKRLSIINLLPFMLLCLDLWLNMRMENISK